MMIQAKDVGVTFRPGDALETEALRSVSLSVEAGEFITVIGSNGAGKSTLLGVLAGDVAPTRGRVMMDGQDVTATPAHRRAGAVARVFQNPLSGTCAELTIEENMALALARGSKRGIGRAVSAKRRAMFKDRLTGLNLGLENRLGETAGGLSGGQRQALCLVMATLADARILLLDEHTAALDPRMAEFVLDLTQKLAAQYKLAALMVTHSMKSALACGDRTIMLHRGQVVLDAGGEKRRAMGVPGLLRLFSEHGAHDDRVLLG